MKHPKLVVTLSLLLAVLFSQKAQAQKSFVYDTIKHREVQFGLTPVMFVLLGANNFGNSGVSLAYQYYFKNYTALRAKVAAFPFRTSSDLEYMALFNRSVDTVNVFSSNYNNYKPTGQVTLAFEKFFRIGQQAHSWVAELGYQHQTTFVNQTYVWYPSKMELTTENMLKFSNGDTIAGNNGARIYNKVDSLSYRFNQTTQSIVVHLAYSIRHQFNSHWTIFGSIGPTFAVGQKRRSGFMGASNAAKFPTVCNFDARLLVTEVCLGYRF